MELTAKERQGRGLDALARGLRPYVEACMSAALPAAGWVALYEQKESHRRGRPFRANLDDPRQLLQILRYERAAFPDLDASQRAWLDELIQSANRAAHVTSVSQAEADRALDTMLLLAQSLGLDGTVPGLVELRLMAGAAPSRTAEPAGPDAPPSIASPPPTSPPPAEPPAAEPPSTGLAVETPDLDLPAGVVAVVVRRPGLTAVVRHQEAVNLALSHNRVSPVRGLHVVNDSDRAVTVDWVEVAVQSPPEAQDVAVGTPLRVPVGVLGPGETFEAQTSDLAMLLNPAVFLRLDEAATTTLTVSVAADGSTQTAGGPVRLLTAEEWWATGVPELLAAFVRPNDPAVAELLRSASELLGARTGSSSLEGYQSGAGRVRAIAEAVFDALAARRLTYAEPPASFEGTGQRIRTHSQVLTDGLATCLDLACLYAAALEQAGLHPVLAVFEGHAFTGYLNEEEQLPAVVVRDQPTAVTIADSDFFDAVELTVVCRAQPEFEQARQATTRWWTTDLGQLRFLLDVHAAHHRVRPLPTVRLDGDVRVIEVRDPAWSAPPRPPSRTEPRRSAPTGPVTTPARVQRWERALLDMTYANPLLKRKAASSLALHVPAGALGVFEDRVAAGESFGLRANDEIDQIHRAQGARTAAEVDPISVRAILEREHTVFVAVPERDYSRRLKTLARRSRTSIEETGSDNLYLTLGLLEWTDGARRGAAPLFLVPVRLTGGRGVVGFSLGFDESRERVPNYCLIEKLKTFGLDVPALEDPGSDQSGLDIDGALGALRTAILQTRNTVGFHVEETADLALLQFSTLEMWQDLRANWPSFVERRAVRHLVEHPGSVFSDGITPPEPAALDEATTYLPIPADGSQIEAVRWAASGKTFILEGPPGTGKSQTITNLIADSMANGRRVLFVAEKAAALEVVRRRLNDIGLGVFSLDVHGRTQTVSAVREQLRTALAERAVPEPGWEPLRSAYAAVTTRLADYPARLHQSGPVGLSAWDARQLVLEQISLGTPAAEAVPVPRQVVLGEVALTDLYRWAAELAGALTDLGRRPAESPWRFSGALDPDALPRDQIAAAVVELRDARQGLDAYGDAALLTASLTSAEELDVLADWLDSVEAGRAWPPSAAAGLVTGPWRDEAARRSEAVEAFRLDASTRLPPFSAAGLGLATDQLLARAQEADRKFFGKKRRRRELLAELQPVLSGPLDPAGLSGALLRLDQLRRAHHDLGAYVAALPGVALRPGWSALDDRDVRWLVDTTSALTAAARLRTTAAGQEGPPLRELDATAERLVAVQGPGQPRGAAEVRRWAQAWRQFCGLLATNPATLAGWLAGRSVGAAVAAELPGWLADSYGSALIELQRWARVRALLHRFTTLGMDDLVRRAYAGGLDPDDLEPQVRLGAAQAVLEERLATTGLNGFDEADHGRRVADFGSRADTIRSRMPNELRSRVLAARTFDPDAAVGQVAELRSELARRRSGRSVRRLLHDFEGLITQITPCLLMSPQSVARFLPTTASFDLVVFDEASQIRVPESIGAIGRAQAAVIVGDSKQMPPTSMFAATGDDTDDAGQPEDGPGLVPADLESILSEAVESQFPRKLLSWHYRSRNESLIAFSNAHYYDGRLSSFPVAPDPGTSSPIELRRVDGTWEGGSRGAARVNQAEARAIVAEVERLVTADPATSIGVVTFNSQQRDLVLDLLEADDHAGVADRLQAEDEPLFVKNLENVQGDERDVILFSLAFSADERGRVPLNWGPLTRAGGERRLNVAITRAKERVVIFGSFDPTRLDLASSSSQGLSDLKDYLLLASASRTTTSRSRRDAHDAHLADLAAALAGAGLEVLTNVGLSDFVVDLAVRTPGSPHWLALLLDGPAWAARLSVGDRETLPPSVLTRMGWTRVERVWLPTWLRNRDQVVASVRAAAASLATPPAAPAGPIGAVPPGPVPDSAEQRPPGGDPGEPTDSAVPGPVRAVAPAPASETAAPAGPPAAGPAATGPTGPTAELTVFRPAPAGPRHATTELDGDSARQRGLVAAEFQAVVAAESPVLAERLLLLVAGRFGLSRLHATRRTQLQSLAPRDLLRQSANGDWVAWAAGSDRDRYTDFRVPGPGERRDLSMVPYEELRNAMVHLTRAGHGVASESLLRETAHLFGVTRLASAVRPRLEAVLAAAVQEGRLAVTSGTVVLPVEHEHA